ncbi:MAG: META domain-containing protein [Neisseria sp.]|nr:META domain-containing protein [Neisseria sp.]
MESRWRQTAGVVLLTLLTACASAPSSVSAMDENTWQSARIEQLNEHDFPATALTGSEFALSADGAQQKNVLNGHAYVGCNQIGFQAAFGEQGKVRFHDVYSTRMMCHDGGLENAFLAALEQVNAYAHSGQSLILYRDDAPVMTLVPQQK